MSQLETSQPIEKAIIWLHGLGADGKDLHPVANILNLDSTRHVFPNAPVIPVSLNGGMPMRAWFDVQHLEDASGINLLQTQASCQAIHKLIDEQIESGINSENIFLIGFSQGGSVAIAAGLSYPQQLAGIAGLSTFFPNPKTIPLQFSHANKPGKMFLAHGTADEVLTYKLGQETNKNLQQQGYQTSWHSYNMGHEICNAEIIDLREWLIK